MHRGQRLIWVGGESMTSIEGSLDAVSAWVRGRLHRVVLTAVMSLAGSVVLAGAASAQADLGGWVFGPVEGSSANDPASERQALKEFERNPPPGFPTLAMANIEATKAAIKHYTDIVAGGGWVAVPDATVKPGESHFAIVELRDRLRVSGELAAGSSHSEVLDDELVQALKAFQTTNGLTPSGVSTSPRSQPSTFPRPTA